MSIPERALGPVTLRTVALGKPPGRRLIGVIAGLAFGIAACTGGAPTPGPTSPAPSDQPGPSSEGRPSPSPDLSKLRATTLNWKTDFTKTNIDLSEIISGGPPKDGIPSIDEPRFESIAAARSWLADQSPVIALEIGGDARAYPLAILIWHEIVNDTVGGVPVVVTFCPLCNTALVFERRIDGRVLDFGTTGNLRHSDLVMYDRQTESWWQQAIGEGIVGEYTGRRLTFLPAQIVSLSDFEATYPAGRVLSRETGYRRDYGRNPYVGYDRVDQRPFLFSGSSTAASPRWSASSPSAPATRRSRSRTASWPGPVSPGRRWPAIRSSSSGSPGLLRPSMPRASTTVATSARLVSFGLWSTAGFSPSSGPARRARRSPTARRVRPGRSPDGRRAGP